MALQVWLPLNGNLNNQGLGDINISGTPTYTSGKIGSGLSNRILLSGYSSYLQPSHTNSISIACWIRSTTNDYIIACGAFEFRGSPSVVQFRLGNGSTNTYAATSSIKPLADEWVHVVGVWNADNKMVLCYLNGTKVAEYQANNSINFNTISSNFYLPYNGTNVCINDFRLYDHALSNKEVREISKGLCVHYPLNDAYIENTTNLGNTSSTYSNMNKNSEYAAGSWGGDAGTITYYSNGGYNDYPYKVYHKTSTGSGGIYKKTDNDIELIEGHTYTMSVYVKASIEFTDSSYSFNINRGSDNYYINYGKSFKFTTEWQRLEKTFTVGTGYGGLYGEMSIVYYDGIEDYYVYYSGFQIEEKDHATPYTPVSRNETIVYDCSGNNFNGTKSGNISIVNDSMRNSCSASFPCSCAAKIYNENVPKPLKDITFSCWCKIVGTNARQFIMSMGRDDTQSGFNLLLNENNNYCVHGSFGTLNSGISANNEWTMIAGTYDGTKVKCYVNGELKQELAYTSDLTYVYGPAFVVGKMAYRYDFDDYYFPVNGSISDVRFYATALSADDIKELYNAPTHITKTGTLMTQGEVIE